MKALLLGNALGILGGWFLKQGLLRTPSCPGRGVPKERRGLLTCVKVKNPLSRGAVPCRDAGEHQKDFNEPSSGTKAIRSNQQDSLRKMRSLSQVFLASRHVRSESIMGRCYNQPQVIELVWDRSHVLKAQGAVGFPILSANASAPLQPHVLLLDMIFPHCILSRRKALACCIRHTEV